MRKPWQTPAWKKRRSELLKGKSCEWCGSTEKLAIHHKEKFNKKQEYNKISYSYLTNHFKDGKNKDEKQTLMKRAKEEVVPEYFDACPSCGNTLQTRKIKTPKYRCQRCMIETDNPVKKLHPSTSYVEKRKFKSLFYSLHREDINKLYGEEKKKAYEKYMAFEDVMVLCKKCNYSIEQGLVFCKVCKQSYHKPKYEMCWECFKKTETGQRVAIENDLLQYVHPWCGKEFQIRRKSWNNEANPVSCCLELCDVDVYSCEIAEKHKDDQQEW